MKVALIFIANTDNTLIFSFFGETYTIEVDTDPYARINIYNTYRLEKSIIHIDKTYSELTGVQIEESYDLDSALRYFTAEPPVGYTGHYKTTEIPNLYFSKLFNLEKHNSLLKKEKRQPKTV